MSERKGKAKKDRFHQLIQLLTDEENQPHQYVGNPDLLKEEFIRVFENIIEKARKETAKFTKGLK